MRLPDGNGLDLHGQLVAEGNAPPVVFVSGFGDIPLVVQAMRQGALAFLEKPFGAQTLLDRIHEAVAYSARQRRERLASKSVEARIALLTPREREVMALMARGKTSKAIGAALGISIRTAEHHRARVREKMRIASVPALVAVLARRHR
jgi:FixJ family two-component response regulator